MTERSVQIWFQNRSVNIIKMSSGNILIFLYIYRRAKIKLIAKKSIETGEDYDLIPESMRQYLMQTESGKGLGLDRGMGYNNNMLMTPEPSSGKIGMFTFDG